MSNNSAAMREALEAARDLLLPQCNGGTAFAKACGETVNKIMDALKEERTSNCNAAAHTMTLDEAIAHAEDVADRCDTSCGLEHRQLANWLKELRDVKRMPVGNEAAIREALEKCANMGEQIDCQLGSSDETVYAFRHERCLAHNISECARAALSIPLRNCDVGTADEQYKRFMNMCNSKDAKQCASCSMRGFTPGCSRDRCFANWAQMPYEEGGAK